MTARTGCGAQSTTAERVARIAGMDRNQRWAASGTMWRQPNTKAGSYGIRIQAKISTRTTRTSCKQSLTILQPQPLCLLLPELGPELRLGADARLRQQWQKQNLSPPINPPSASSSRWPKSTRMPLRVPVSRPLLQSPCQFPGILPMFMLRTRRRHLHTRSLSFLCHRQLQK